MGFDKRQIKVDDSTIPNPRIAVARKAIDDELRTQGWTMEDAAGHVDVFDGDVNTHDIAEAVVNALEGKA